MPILCEDNEFFYEKISVGYLKPVASTLGVNIIEDFYDQLF